MPVDKGGERGEQPRPDVWERIETERPDRDRARKAWDAEHGPSEEFERAARPLPADYGKDRPAARTVTPGQHAEMVETWGQQAVDRMLASGRIALDGDHQNEQKPSPASSDNAAGDWSEGHVESSAADSGEERRGEHPDTSGDAAGEAADITAGTIEATRAEVDAAYATGDPEMIAAALRDALTKIEGSPEQQTTWRTIADEMAGEVKSFPNYEAAKRALGVEPGTEIHHIVEQAQARPERSGFDLARINSTDNLTRIPPDVHRQISALYSSKPPGFDTTIRDQRDGESWEDQYEYGRAVLNEYLGEQSNDDS